MEFWSTLRAWATRLFVPASFLFLSAPVTPEYPVDNSMSTLARFPWVWACVMAIASDQAGLPLVASRSDGRKGKRTEVDDPALALLEQPNAAMSGRLFRMQLWLDYRLTGNAFIWRPDGPGSIAIYRLHPASVRPIAGPMGMALGYEWTDSATGETRTLPNEQIIHIRGVSWQDSTVSMLGESVVRCLHDDLTTEMGQKKTASIQAARGRPDILFSSKTPIGDKGSDKIIERWEKEGAARTGAFFVGGEITATKMSWSAVDSGEIERSSAIRDTVLAVFGVPRVRLGLSDSNYATARQAEKGYWQGLKGEAKVFDDAFSQLAAPGVRISHDYSTVEALQVSYTERQARMKVWIDLGWSPEAAAAIEGFDALPPRTGEPKSATAPSAPASASSSNPDEPAAPPEKALAAATRAALVLHLRCAEAVYGEANETVDTRLLVRWQSERLFAALTDAGHDPITARWWAEEVCGTVDEAHRMGLADAFAESRATLLAERITTRRAA